MEAGALAVSGEAGAGGDARRGTHRAAAAAAMTGEVGEWTGGGGELSGGGGGQGHWWLVGPPPGRVGPGKDGGSPNHTAAKLKKNHRQVMGYLLSLSKHRI